MKMSALKLVRQALLSAIVLATALAMRADHISLLVHASSTHHLREIASCDDIAATLAHFSPGLGRAITRSSSSGWQASLLSAAENGRKAARQDLGGAEGQHRWRAANRALHELDKRASPQPDEPSTYTSYINSYRSEMEDVTRDLAPTSTTQAVNYPEGHPFHPGRNGIMWLDHMSNKNFPVDEEADVLVCFTGGMVGEVFAPSADADAEALAKYSEDFSRESAEVVKRSIAHPNVLAVGLAGALTMTILPSDAALEDFIKAHIAGLIRKDLLPDPSQPDIKHASRILFGLADESVSMEEIQAIARGNGTGTRVRMSLRRARELSAGDSMALWQTNTAPRRAQIVAAEDAMREVSGDRKPISDPQHINLSCPPGSVCPFSGKVGKKCPMAGMF